MEEPVGRSLVLACISEAGHLRSELFQRQLRFGERCIDEGNIRRPGGLESSMSAYVTMGFICLLVEKID